MLSNSWNRIEVILGNDYPRLMFYFASAFVAILNALSVLRFLIGGEILQVIVGMILYSYGVRSIWIVYPMFILTSTLTFAFPAYLFLAIGRKYFSNWWTKLLMAGWLLVWMIVYYFGSEVGP